MHTVVRKVEGGDKVMGEDEDGSKDEEEGNTPDESRGEVRVVPGVAGRRRGVRAR